jgi:opacity protein-like surface antigen
MKVMAFSPNHLLPKANRCFPGLLPNPLASLADWKLLHCNRIQRNHGPDGFRFDESRERWSNSKLIGERRIPMRKLLLGAVASTAMFLGTMQASAADIEVAPEPMGLSWYVSVFGGWSFNAEVEGDFEYDAVSGSGYDLDLDLDDGFTAGIAVGAHINEWLRGEIELSGNWHDGDGDLDRDDGAYWNVDGDADAMFVLANLWLDIPIGTVFRPYVGGGIGFGRLDLDLETTTSGYSIFDDDDWGFAYQLGVGVAFDFAENIALDVGYRYKAIQNVDIGVDSDWGTGFDDLEADYHSHNVIAGIRIGF